MPAAAFLIALLTGPPAPGTHFTPELKTDLGPHEHRVAFLHTIGFSGDGRFPELTTVGQKGMEGWGADHLGHRRDDIGRGLKDENRLMHLMTWIAYRPEEHDGTEWEGFGREIDGLFSGYGVNETDRKKSLERRRLVRDLLAERNRKALGPGKRLNALEVQLNEVPALSVEDRRRVDMKIRNFLWEEVQQVYLVRRLDVDRSRKDSPVQMTVQNSLDWQFPSDGGDSYSPGQARKVLREQTFVVLDAEGVRELVGDLKREVDDMEVQVEKLPDLLARDPDVAKLNDLIDQRVERLVEKRLEEELNAMRMEFAALKKEVAAAGSTAQAAPNADDP